MCLYRRVLYICIIQVTKNTAVRPDKTEMVEMSINVTENVQNWSFTVTHFQYSYFS